MDSSNLYNTPQVSQAQQAAQQASNTASQAAQSAATLPDMLKEALTKKFEGNPLYGQRETALKNYLNTSTQAPLDYTAKSGGGNSDVVYSPLQQANLIQSRKSATLVPLTTLNDLLGLEYGGLQNIIDSASRASQAQVAGLQSNAQMKRQDYQDLIDTISRQADENYRQAQLQLEKQRAAQSTSSGIADLLALLPALGIGSNNTQNNTRPSLDSLREEEPKQQTAPNIPLNLNNLNIGTGLGMGNIPTSKSQPKKSAPKKEALPTFKTWNQLFGY